jgi:hypothetical protein
MYARQGEWEPEQMRTALGIDTALGRWMIDELLECYVAWREECHAVSLAYQRWVDGARSEAWRAYVGYVAALDREEHAARTYADRIERFSREPSRA